MNIKALIIFLSCTMVIILFSGCNRKGCTDCNAVNYSQKAEKDDGSCMLLHQGRFATYDIEEVIQDPFQTTFTSNYTINIERDECGIDDILIINYSNLTNSQNIPFRIQAKIDGDSIRIFNQTHTGPDPGATTDLIDVDATTGFFFGDSIFVPIAYSDRFDPYVGFMRGRKR